MDKFLAGRLSLPVNLQFFKGGSTETVRKRDPKSGQHLAMDEAVFNLLSPIAMRYGGSDIFGDTLPKASTAVQPNAQQKIGQGGGYWGQTEAGNGNGYWTEAGDNGGNRWVPTGSNQPSQTVSNGKLGSVQPGSVQPSGNATDPLMAFNDSILGHNLDYADRQHEMVNRNTDDLLGKLPGYLDQSNDTLGKMEDLADNYVSPYGNDAFDEYVRKMGETAEYSAGRADKYYDDADFYLGQNKDLATQGTSQALENLVAKMSDSLKSNYQSDAGSLLSNAANRGIINSSVSTRGLSDLSNAMADAATGQYMQGFQALLDNSLKGATTAGGLAQGVVDTAGKANANYQDIVNSMLGINADSLKTMQTQAGIYSDASAGYNRDYNSGIGSLETYAKLPAQYYQNALAPISPLYNYWKDLTDSYYGHEDFDTVVKQGK